MVDNMQHLLTANLVFSMERTTRLGRLIIRRGNKSGIIFPRFYLNVIIIHISTVTETGNSSIVVLQRPGEFGKRKFRLGQTIQTTQTIKTRYPTELNTDALPHPAEFGKNRSLWAQGLDKSIILNGVFTHIQEKLTKLKFQHSIPKHNFKTITMAIPYINRDSDRTGQTLETFLHTCQHWEE